MTTEAEFDLNRPAETIGRYQNVKTHVQTPFLGLGRNVTVSGKVTSTRENTRSNNQSAKYQVRVYAHQQEPTEGLSKLMDILASYTETLPSTDSGAS